VREVGLEHHVVGIEVDEARQRLVLEPERAVHLPLEVLARQQAVGVGVLGTGVEELPVHRLEQVRQVAEA